MTEERLREFFSEKFRLAGTFKKLQKQKFDFQKSQKNEEFQFFRNKFKKRLPIQYFGTNKAVKKIQQTAKI